MSGCWSYQHLLTHFINRLSLFISMYQTDVLSASTTIPGKLGTCSDDDAEDKVIVWRPEGRDFVYDKRSASSLTNGSSFISDCTTAPSEDAEEEEEKDKLKKKGRRWFSFSRWRKSSPKKSSSS